MGRLFFILGPGATQIPQSEKSGSHAGGLYIERADAGSPASIQHGPRRSAHGFPCLVFLTAPRLSADEVEPPSGNLRPDALADLKPHPSGSKTYNEFWTYHFILDGNIQAYLNFSRVNLGPSSPRYAAPISPCWVSRAATTPWPGNTTRANFVFLDSLHQLQVHQNIWFSGKLPESHRVFFSTRRRTWPISWIWSSSEFSPERSGATACSSWVPRKWASSCTSRGPG